MKCIIMDTRRGQNEGPFKCFMGKKCASSGVGKEKVMPVPDKPLVLSRLLA